MVVDERSARIIVGAAVKLLRPQEQTAGIGKVQPALDHPQGISGRNGLPSIGTQQSPFLEMNSIGSKTEYFTSPTAPEHTTFCATFTENAYGA